LCPRDLCAEPLRGELSFTFSSGAGYVATKGVTVAVEFYKVRLRETEKRFFRGQFGAQTAERANCANRAKKGKTR
jgi:hypothetical protein